jgi:hypothetical protein
LVVVWQDNLPDHDQQRSSRFSPTVKPEAPSAVVCSWWWAGDARNMLSHTQTSMNLSSSQHLTKHLIKPEHYRINKKETRYGFILFYAPWVSICTAAFSNVLVNIYSYPHFLHILIKTFLVSWLKTHETTTAVFFLCNSQDVACFVFITCSNFAAVAQSVQWLSYVLDDW